MMGQNKKYGDSQNKEYERRILFQTVLIDGQSSPRSNDVDRFAVVRTYTRTRSKELVTIRSTWRVESPTTFRITKRIRPQ